LDNRKDSWPFLDLNPVSSRRYHGHCADNDVLANQLMLLEFCYISVICHYQAIHSRCTSVFNVESQSYGSRQILKFYSSNYINVLRSCSILLEYFPLQAPLMTQPYIFFALCTKSLQASL